MATENTAPANATVTTGATQAKGKQISATLSPEEFAELRSYRFKHEIEQYSSIVREAVLKLVRADQ